MEFGNITQEEWTKMVNQQLKDGSIENYAQWIEDLPILPYDTEQNLTVTPNFQTDIEFLGNVKFKDPYSENYFGTIEDFLKKDIQAGYVQTHTLAQCVDIEENMPGNSFTYWLDLYELYETEENARLDLEEHANNWETLSDKIQNKIQFVINISLHQNCGAGITEQIGIAISKLNELVCYFSPSILSQIVFKVALGDKYLIEIAKIRALRMAFANYIAAFHINDIEAQIIGECSNLNKTPTETENNLIRSTLEISSGTLGGSDYFLLHPYSDTEDPEWANDVSLKQGLILTQEAMLNFYNDALAGSYTIEKLTYAIGEKSWEVFQNIEKKGGYSDDFDHIVKSIYNQLTQHIQKINSGKIIIIGYNKYGSKEFQPIKVPKASSVLKPFRLP